MSDIDDTGPEPLSEDEFESFARRLNASLEQKIKSAAAQESFGSLPQICSLRDQWQHLWFGGSVTPGQINLRKALFPKPHGSPFRKPSRSPFRPPEGVPQLTLEEGEEGEEDAGSDDVPF